MPRQCLVGSLDVGLHARKPIEPDIEADTNEDASKAVKRDRAVSVFSLELAWAAASSHSLEVVGTHLRSSSE